MLRSEFKCQCLCTAVKLCLISNLLKIKYLEFEKCLFGRLWLFVSGLWSLAGGLCSFGSGLWLFASGLWSVVVFCWCFVVIAGSLWSFDGSLWLFAGSLCRLLMVCDRLCSFVVVCRGSWLLLVLVTTH